MASPFSGKAGRNAAVWQAGYLQDQQNNIDKTIEKGKKSSLASLAGGYKTATGDYQKAIDLYDPYATTGLNAFNQYADATGVNGQGGYDRSVDNFHAGPGYQWNVDQSTDAVARKSSALGALGSGNTMTAIQDRAHNLADQEYNGYLDRLNGIGQVGYDATGKQAGLTKSLGDLGYSYGQDKSNVYANSTGLGVSSLANTSGLIANAGKEGMLAGQNAAANKWNMGMSLVSSLAGAAGSYYGAKRPGA